MKNQERNEKCNCGSGVKYKKCCMKNDTIHSVPTPNYDSEPQKVMFKSFDSDDEMEQHFSNLRNQIAEEWESVFEAMSPYNVDLSWSYSPLLDTTYKSDSCGKKLRLVIIDDERIVTLFNKKYNQSRDVIIQLFDVASNKSAILREDIREDANVNWRGDRLALSKSESVLTSLLLNTSEGINPLPFYVVDDLVKSVADKNKFYNVFSVLD